MGIGDEIMVTGEVEKRGAGNARRFAIRDPRYGKGEHRWHEMWEGNPRIAKPGEQFDDWIVNTGGHRPYIQQKTSNRWFWKKYEPIPGRIYLTEDEKNLADWSVVDKVILQPSIKHGASPNKNWGLANWQALVDRGTHIPWLEVGQGEPRLRGVQFLRTPTFRAACGVLSGARAAVLQEGGLHHAAAALSVRALVIFGGFISPEVTGYRRQKNMFVRTADHPLGCGMRVPCAHCVAVMAQLTPAMILRTLEEML